VSKTGKVTVLLVGCLIVLGAVAPAAPRTRGDSRPAASTESRLAGASEPAPGGGPTKVVCGEMSKADDTDLTGTVFRGTVIYPAAGINENTTATLVITETNPTTHERTFELAPEGGIALRGRFSARTTCGYTGAAMRFNDSTVSVRACRERGGVAFRSSAVEGFEFLADNEPAAAPGAVKWGRCNGSGRLRGKRPSP
jgi:hypothetical protein